MKFNDSVYNQSWQDKQLSDLGKFQRGKSRHRPRNDSVLFENGEHPLVQTGEIKEANLYIRKHSVSYNDFGLAQSKLWPADTLCITIAANIAETALLGYPMCFPDSVVGFNADPKESSELFMHYVFTYIRRTIQSSASGSIQDNINIDYLTGLEFKIPEKPYQDRIVAVLSALDAKIELNNRINAELESMAKTLYDYWFVQFDFPCDFAQGRPDANGRPYKSSGGKMVYNPTLKRKIPEGWDVSTIGDTFPTSLGGTPSRINPSYWAPPEINWLNSEDKETLYVVEADEKISREGLKNSAAKLLPVGTVILSIVRHLRASILGVEAATNQSVVGIEETDTIKHCFIYPLISREIPRYMALRTGAQQPHINKAVVDETGIVLPDDPTMKAYVQLTGPIFEKIRNNQCQTQQLTELRDWLLPMLMNGQVQVA
ncbi:MAG: restriction endonuclease subunit S [Pontiellaceae bacterium]|nr:restriction endonuclease subunit S [Pontiellaceae bacterium]